MKKVLLILWLCMPLFSFAQTDTTTTNSDYQNWEYEYLPETDTFPEVINNLTAGDHLSRAGTNYLVGTGMMVAGTASSIVFAIEVPEKPKLQYISLGVSIVGAIITVAGHIQLIEAGKKLNSDAVTLSAASEGIGLAINF